MQFQQHSSQHAWQAHDRARFQTHEPDRVFALFTLQEDEHDNKVLEILEPISAALGRPPLVLGFNNLSVWAPVNPKKDGVGTKAWKTLTCRRGEVNPKRQILYDVSGQVGRLLSFAFRAKRP